MRRSTLVGLAAAAVLAASTVAIAGGLRWELGIKTETPSWVKVSDGPGERTRVVWYGCYTVENKTGETRKPTVRCEIHTDTKKVFRDGGDAQAILALKKRAGNESLATAVDLRKGLDNDKSLRCVATFGAVDDRAKKLELRIYGLHDPVHQVKGKEVHEIRYWRVQYERPGDEFGRTEDAWKSVSSGWVTEEPEKKAEN